MENLKIRGKYLGCKAIKEFGTGFRKRSFYIDNTPSFVEDDRPRSTPEIEIVGDKVDEINLDDLEVGQTIDVSVNVRGRKWTSPEGKEVVFTSLQAWRIETVTTTEALKGKTDVIVPDVPDDKKSQEDDVTEDDDLPF